MDEILFVRRTPYHPQEEECDDFGDQLIDNVRTDFILQNVFAFLIRPSIQIETIEALNSKESRTLSLLQDLTLSFKKNHEQKINLLCFNLIMALNWERALNDESLSEFSSSFTRESTQDEKEMRYHESILNKLETFRRAVLCIGVSSHVIIFSFVFVGEFTLNCLATGHKEEVVDIVLKWYSVYFKDNFSQWIESNGGWEGLSDRTWIYLFQTTVQYFIKLSKKCAEFADIDSTQVIIAFLETFFRLL